MENEKRLFKYCDILSAIDNFDVETEDGETVHVEKDSTGIVGFDKSIHYLKQHLIEEIDEETAKIEGISVRGLSEYLASYLDSGMDMSKMLKDWNMDMDMLVEYLVSAFVELGLKDDLAKKEDK